MESIANNVADAAMIVSLLSLLVSTVSYFVAKRALRLIEQRRVNPRWSDGR